MCHIHVGYEYPNVESSLYIVKYLDAILGCASILIDPDEERRKLYGKAGCFRLTKYGVEYRVLSGYFISSREVISDTYDLMKAGLSAYNNSMVLPPNEVIVDIINNNNKKLAKYILETYYNKFKVVNKILSTITEE